MSRGYVEKAYPTGYGAEAENSELLAGEVKRKVRLLDYKSVCRVDGGIGK